MGGRGGEQEEEGGGARGEEEGGGEPVALSCSPRELMSFPLRLPPFSTPTSSHSLAQPSSRGQVAKLARVPGR